MPFGGFSGKGCAASGFFPPAGIMLEISFFPTSARASSASSPEATVLSSTTLFSDEAALVASCCLVLEASRSPASSEELSAICPPHAATRSTTMPSMTTTATFAPNSFLGSSVLKGAAFHFSSGKGIYEAEDTMDLARGCLRPGATYRGAICGKFGSCTIGYYCCVGTYLRGGGKY